MRTFNRIWVVSLITGAVATAGFAQSPVYIVRHGDPVPPPGGESMAVVNPGGSVRLSAWLVDAEAPGVQNFQVVVSGTATPNAGANGTVTYVDNPPPFSSDSVEVDVNNPDGIFFPNLIDAQVFYLEAATGFGFIVFPSAPPSVFVGARYLGEFEFEASADACGSFELGFVPIGEPPGGGTGFAGPGGGEFLTTLNPITIFVNALCNEACCCTTPFCMQNDGCLDLSLPACAQAAGTPQGPGSVCADTDCSPETEACCFGDGTCTDISFDDCVAEGGSAQGMDTSCDVDGCPPPPEIIHSLGQPGETQPCTGYIDPRRESSNGVLVDLGLAGVTLEFNEEVFSIGGGPLGPGDFSVHETGVVFNVDGSQENPPNGSASDGLGTVSLNDAETQLTIDVEHTLATVTAGHIHRAPAGSNGPVVFPLPGGAASPINAVWNLSASDVADYKAGNLYLNLHSAAFPGGEIRGQIVPNEVDSVDDSNNPLVSITLARPISLQEWTTVQAHVENAAGIQIVDGGNMGPGNEESDRIDIGFMPCDVDQSGGCGPFDLLRFRQYVNNVISPPCGADLDFLDIDRDGASGPFDLLRFRQLVNGVTPATRAWSFQSLNSPQP